MLKPKIGIDEIHEKADVKIESVERENEKRNCKTKRKTNTYKVGDLVMIRNFGPSMGKLAPQFKGPYEVVKVFRNDRYLVSDLEGFQNTQRHYQGESKNMRRWASNVNPENEEISDKTRIVNRVQRIELYLLFLHSS